MISGIRRLYRLLAGRSKRDILLVVLLSTAGGVCSVAFVSLLQLTAAGRSTRAPVSLPLVMIVLAIAAPVIRVTSQILLVRIAERTVSELLLRLCERVLATSLSHLERIGANRIESAFTADIVSVTSGLMSLPVVVLNSVVVLGCFVWIGLVSPGGLALIAVFCALAVTSSWIGSKWGGRHLVTARKHLDLIYSHWRALTFGTKELKLHAGRREAFISEMVLRDVMAYRRHSLAARGLFAMTLGAAQMTFFFLLLVIVLILPQMAQAGLATVASLIVTLFFMLGFLEGLMGAAPEIVRAGVALDNLESLDLRLAPEIPGPIAAAPALPVIPAAADRGNAWELEFVQVMHTYQRDREPAPFVVGPLSFVLRPAEIVFVVGGNGAGKTTFAKLLSGLYVPDSGMVTFNGERIDDQNRDAYRQRFSAVFSDCYVFKQLLGIDQDMIEREGRQQVMRLGLETKVTIADRAFTTLELSRGQFKRLALLTACLEDRQIYLFDEWAADQDPAFKQVFYHQILQGLKARGKGIVVITHDDKYFHVADRMFTLVDGHMTAARVPRLQPVGREAIVDARSALPQYD